MDKRYNLKNIRTVLTEGFTAEELRQLCFEVSAFRFVYNQLAESTGKSKIVRLLLEHAEQKELIEILLDEVKERNPNKYEKCKPYYTISLSQPIVSSTVRGKSQRAKIQIIKKNEMAAVLNIVLKKIFKEHYEPKQQEIIDACKLWDNMSPEERYTECRRSTKYFIHHNNRYYPLKPIMRLVARPAIDKLPKLPPNGPQYTVEKTQVVAKSLGFSLVVCTNRRCNEDPRHDKC
jgi:hypothetical protein